MSNELTIAVIQYTPVWNNKKENYFHISTLLDAAKADVIVLPELCTTGYFFLSNEEAIEAADTAENIATFFQPFADKSKAVIIAGFAEKAGDQAYNSAIIVLPNQSFSVYRKTHLFYKEKICFAPGDTGFKTVEHPLKDCRIGIMVCYDWRFPESARTLALQGADVICCPANLVTTVWEIGMKARALENNVFVAVANRCGSEKRILEDGSTETLSFTGNSVVYDINGSELIKAAMEESVIITTTVDISRSRNKHFNELNDVLKDRRPEMYGLEL